MEDILSLGVQDFVVSNNCRWFLKQGDSLSFDRGFATKADASAWIKSLGRQVDWRAGFVFRLLGGSHDLVIVNRLGVRAKI